MEYVSFTHKTFSRPCPRHMILALGFPKGGGRVPAPHLIVSNHGSTLIGVNTHDTDPTVSTMEGNDAMTWQ